MLVKNAMAGYVVVGILSEPIELQNICVLGKYYHGNDVALYEKFVSNVVFLDAVMDIYNGICALLEIRKIYPNAMMMHVIASIFILNKLEIRK